MADKTQKVTQLLWLDMEMTGLDVNREAIIEIAALVTNMDLEELSHYHAIVRQDSHYLDHMDEWNTKHHGKSGLTALVPTGRPQQQVEAELIELINRHWPASERAILAGNSIYQDRIFIQKHLPLLEQRLHYRMLDVSAWKIIMQAKYDYFFKKKDGHRAIDDIRESLEELRAYLARLHFVAW